MNFWVYFLFLQLLSFAMRTMLKLLWPKKPLRTFITLIKKPAYYSVAGIRFIILRINGYEIGARNIKWYEGTVKIPPTRRNLTHGSFLKILYAIFTPCLLVTLGMIWMIEHWNVLKNTIYLIIGSIYALLILVLAAGITQSDVKKLLFSFNDRMGTSLRQLLEIISAVVGYSVIYSLLDPYQEFSSSFVDFCVISTGIFCLELIVNLFILLRNQIKRRNPNTTKISTPHISLGYQSAKKEHRRSFYSKIEPVNDDLQEECPRP